MTKDEKLRRKIGKFISQPYPKPEERFKGLSDKGKIAILQEENELMVLMLKEAVKGIDDIRFKASALGEVLLFEATEIPF